LVVLAAPGAGAGTVVGRVTSLLDGGPLVAVRVRTSGVAVATNVGGRYVIPGLASGDHSLEFVRIGFLPATRRVTVGTADTVIVDVALEGSVIELPEVRVQAPSGPQPHGRNLSSLNLSGHALEERRSDTIAQTLENEPGMDSRTMGVAPARPVVRGLSGQRVTILADGAPTGDLSATSDDHALVLDALDARSVEVIRGPGALLYGPSSPGGVLNVEEGRIPTQRLTGASGEVALSGSSADRGGAGTARLTGPIGDIGAVLEMTARGANDLRTPAGELSNSDRRLFKGSAGLSWIGTSTRIGGWGEWHGTRYGIPGGFLGGHPNGVDIRLSQRRSVGRLEWSPSGSPARFELAGSWSHYFHEELESNGVCGVSFGLVTRGVAARAHFDRAGPGRTVVGVFGERRDSANGCLSFLPPTRESSAGIVALEEFQLRTTRVAVAARYDHREITPERETTSKAGLVRRRSFGGLTGSIGAVHPFGANIETSVTVARSFRPPALEELFSDGPHLAAYTYEVGNAELGSENGTTIDLAVAWSAPTHRVRLSGYLMDMPDYITPINTGELEYGPGEEGYLQRYQYAGVHARLAGAECDASWDPTDVFGLEMTASAVSAQRLPGDSVLERTPPANGRLSARFRSGTSIYRAAIRWGAAQNRTAEFESPTDGYALVDLSGEWNLVAGAARRVLRVVVENVADTSWRNHLSRLKDIQPEPGRNVRLELRLHWL
jgi:iron complex outermembrane receptor protein